MVRARCGEKSKNDPGSIRGVHFKIQISAVQSQPVLSNRPPRVRVSNRGRGIFSIQATGPMSPDISITVQRLIKVLMIGNNKRQKGGAEVFEIFLVNYDLSKASFFQVLEPENQKSCVIEEL